MPDKMPKACVIIGAGASHDVWNEGAAHVNIPWQPLLATDLFDIGKHPEYAPILSRYPGAEFLSQYLGPVSAQGGHAIDEALRDLAFHDDPRISKQFNQIPPYLRDLIYHTSRQYAPIPSCYIQLVIELLTTTPHEVLFLVLNYDDLLEIALGRLASLTKEFQFKEIDDYISPGRQAKVVKLHGSIDWFVQMPHYDNDWAFAVGELKLSSLTDSPIWVIGDVTDAKIHRMPSSHDYSYPVITAPLAGKGSSATVCPATHVQVAKDFSGTAENS